MSEKRIVYAEDVIQRLRDLAPEILGGWYNPDIEYIYTNLGNGINHELCMKFVQSGCDLGVIDDGLQEKDRRP